MADVFEGVELTPAQKAELDTLRNGYAIVNELWNDGATGLAMKRRLKEKHPDANIVIPEDIAEPLLQPLRADIDAVKTNHTETLEKIAAAAKEVDDKIATFNQTQQDAKDLGDLQSRIDAACRHYRFTGEGRDALIKHMQETNTSDPMTAGAYLVHNIDQPPEPSRPNGMAHPQAIANGAPDVDLFSLATGQTDDDLKLLHSGPRGADKWFNNQVTKILAEPVAA